MTPAGDEPARPPPAPQGFCDRLAGLAGALGQFLLRNGDIAFLGGLLFQLQQQARQAGLGVQECQRALAFAAAAQPVGGQLQDPARQGRFGLENAQERLAGSASNSLSVRAIALVERGCLVSSPSSPKISPGCISLMTISRPSGLSKTIDTRPDRSR